MKSEVHIGSHTDNTWVVTESDVDMSRSKLRPVHQVKLTAIPQDVIVNLNRCALIVVDMQNDFCSPEGYLGRNGMDCTAAQGLVKPINQLISNLRPLSVPVIWLNWAIRSDRLNMGPSMPHVHIDSLKILTQTNPTFAHNKGGWGAFERQWGSEIFEGLDTRNSDIYVTKNRFSGFFNTELDDILRNMNITTLFFAGVAMDICVFATLQDAMFLGYDVLMLEDCVATNSPSFCVEATKHHITQLLGFVTASTSLINRTEVARQN